MLLACIDKLSSLLAPRLSEILEAIDDSEDEEAVLPFLYHASFAATQAEMPTLALKWAGTTPQESPEYFNRLLRRLVKDADVVGEMKLQEMLSVGTSSKVGITRWYIETETDITN